MTHDTTLTKSLVQQNNPATHNLQPATRNLQPAPATCTCNLQLAPAPATCNCNLQFTPSVTKMPFFEIFPRKDYTASAQQISCT